MTGRIKALNISAGGIPKHAQRRIHVDVTGLRGDAHNHDKHNTPLQAVSVFDVETMAALIAMGYDLQPGSIGENLTTEGLPQDAITVGDRLHLGDDVVLEVTKQRKPCYVLDAIDPQLKVDLVGRCGWLCRVVREGMVAAGDSIRLECGAAS